MNLTGVTIARPGTCGIVVAPTASGSATAADVVVTSPGTGGLDNGADAAWTFMRQSGNIGW